MISLVRVCRRKLQKMLGVGQGAVQKVGIKETVVTTTIGLEAHRTRSEADIEVEVGSLEEHPPGVNGAGQEAAPRKESEVAADRKGVGVVRVESNREAL